ncbi:MAG TPA: sensor histidine kinase [Dermatophilaceae bacterium]|nr:sensor histidine kinase [Dermatophilaceae bacterium]
MNAASSAGETAAPDGITRALALGGVVAWAGAVLPAALSHERAEVPPVWWLLAVIHLVAFLAVFTTRSRPARRMDWIVTALLILSGTTAVALWGADQVSPVLLVLTAGSVGWVVGTRWSFVIAGAECVALIVILLVTGESVVWALIYGALMAFAALMVAIVRSESEARQQAAATAAALEIANAELRQTQRALAEVTRADERIRISRDLHDGMGQQLTALGLRLNLMARSVPPESDLAEHVAEARQLLTGVTRDVRGVVSQLRNSPIPVRDEIVRMARTLPRPAIALDLDPSLDSVAPEAGRTLVRIVQEGLTNIAKHAQAEHAWVTVHHDGADVVFDIRDDGPGASQFTPGNGLSGMRERVALLGGELGWRTAAGEGFVLSGRLPDRTAGHAG